MDNNCICGSDTSPRIIKRAREPAAGWPDEWATEIIHECRDCGRRWIA